MPLTRLIGAAWTKDLIKRRLAEENKFFGSYGSINVSFFSNIHILPLYVTIGKIENKDVNKLFLYIFSSLGEVKQGATL